MFDRGLLDSLNDVLLAGNNERIVEFAMVQGVTPFARHQKDRT